MNKLLDIFDGINHHEGFIESEIKLDSNNKIIKKDKYFGIEATVILKDEKIETKNGYIECNTPIIISDSLCFSIKNPLFKRASLKVFVIQEDCTEVNHSSKKYRREAIYKPILIYNDYISIRRSDINSQQIIISFGDRNNCNTEEPIYCSNGYNGHFFRYLVIFVEPEIKMLIKYKEIEDKKNKEIQELKKKLENLYLEFDIKMT